MKNYKIYNILTKLIQILGKLYFNGKVIGKENIPLEGRVILAGNHVSNYDSYLLYSSTKRKIHIIAKIELLSSKFAFIFKRMHLIFVDRKKKNTIANEQVINILNNDGLVAIFPEGTYHKEDLLLPFKGGVISFATKTKSPIIPFAITGNFKFRGKPTITYGKPIYIDEIDGDKLKYLEDTIRKMLTK